METIVLRTIADLEMIGRSSVREFFRKWDFAGEVFEWAKTAAMKGMQWTSKHTWNEDRNHCRFHPSSFKYNCDMRLFLQLIGEEEVKKKQPQQTIFDTGTAIHIQMNYYMHTMAIYNNFTYNDEVRLWKTSYIADVYRLCGSCDGVMEREVVIDGIKWSIRVIIDWKSINDSGFTALRDSTSSDYEKQMHGYMATGDIPVTLVFYVNKDKSIFKSIPVLFDNPKVWKPITDRLSRIIGISDQMKEPPKTVGKHCYGCQYLEKCEPEGLAQRRRGNMEPRFA
jgi:hypothetical protein